MKKIITLLIAVAAVSSAFAQSTSEREQAKDKVFGNHNGTGQYPNNYPNNYPNTYPNNYPQNYPNTYPNNYPQNSVDQINREYDQRIRDVRNNPNISRAEKERQIRALNAEREQRIRSLNGYGNNNRKGRDWDHDRDRDHDRDGNHHDNGKHLGWQKGRGNPHRN